jgi:hypothetical protein
VPFCGHLLLGGSGPSSIRRCRFNDLSPPFAQWVGRPQTSDFDNQRASSPRANANKTPINASKH